MTCLANYDGGGIANLMASLTAGLGGRHDGLPAATLLGPAEPSAYRNVVLLVLDGLGDNLLRVSKEAIWLNRHRRGRLTSVFPPTTATAITTYLTGEPPSRHGLTGWHMYFRELGSVVAFRTSETSWHGHPMPLAGTEERRSLAAYYYTDEPPPGVKAPHSTIYVEGAA